jgi:hypothetical protein
MLQASRARLVKGVVSMRGKAAVPAQAVPDSKELESLREQVKLMYSAA